jgi:hypothetical protein
MPILNIQTTQTGLIGVLPSLAYIQTSDTEAQVLATGYLNQAVQSGLAAFTLPCIASVSTIASAGAAPVVGWFNVSYVPNSGVPQQGNWSLTATSSPGAVVLPTIANHIATYTNTAGTISEDPSIAISGGSIQAGLSGTAGTLISYPATASKGSLVIAGVANTGNTNTTISNDAMGQASVINIPDPTNAVGQFLVGATATPFTSGHILSASGTAGLVADSGIVATNVQLKTQVKAVLSGNIGGAGAGPLTVTVAGMTAASVVVATVSSSSNACYVLTAVAGTGSFALTVSADPGASLIVNYIAYIAGQ